MDNPHEANCAQSKEPLWLADVVNTVDTSTLKKRA